MQEQQLEENKKVEAKPSDAAAQTSPHWPTSTKRIVATSLGVLALLALYAIRSVLIPVITSIILAYVLLPFVDFIQNRTRLGRSASVLLVYLIIIVVMIAIPASTIPQLVDQSNNILNNTPTYVQELGRLLEEPFIIGGFQIPLDQLPLNDLYGTISNNLIAIIQAIGPQSLRLFGATLSTVGWTLIVLVLSYYMVKDYGVLWNSIVTIAPDVYHADMQRIGMETGLIWNAFFRGQLILGLIIGGVTFFMTAIIGLPNALFLGLIAGLLEFIPNVGPVLAAIPAVLLALFQSETSWLGILIGPFWFAVIVLVLYGVVQRIENVYLVPRIIGRSLNLHPLVVLIGAVIGASVAGVIGILLAAPLLATLRLILQYIYRKLLDQPPFGELSN